MPPKLLFKNEEVSLISNAEFLLDKNKILEKIAQELSLSGKKLAVEIEHSYPKINSQFTKLPPKISSGEKYHDLPYLVMDYPRHFDARKTFSYRILFLWGRYFNFSLHLGSDLIDLDALLNHLNASNSPVYLSLHDNPWEHYLEEHNFKIGSLVTFDELSKQLKQNKFVKIVHRVGFDEIESLPDLCIQMFGLLIGDLFMTPKD